ncbi:MAG: DUF2283 domain-containing protein [Candidatus Hodarchaeota archaeon]
MELSYDRIADALYIRISGEVVESSDEVSPGIILDYGKNGNLLGIEVLNFSSRKLNLNEIVQMDPSELVPLVSSC